MPPEKMLSRRASLLVFGTCVFIEISLFSAGKLRPGGVERSQTQLGTERWGIKSRWSLLGGCGRLLAALPGSPKTGPAAFWAGISHGSACIYLSPRKAWGCRAGGRGEGLCVWGNHLAGIFAGGRNVLGSLERLRAARCGTGPT